MTTAGQETNDYGNRDCGEAAGAKECGQPLEMGETRPDSSLEPLDRTTTAKTLTLTQ